MHIGQHRNEVLCRIKLQAGNIVDNVSFDLITSGGRAL